MNSPSPVHENAHTAVTSASGPIAEAGTSIPTISAADDERERGDEEPVDDDGQRAAHEQRQRGAGVIRIEPRVCWKRSPAIDVRHREEHGIEAYWIALPIT